MPKNKKSKHKIKKRKRRGTPLSRHTRRKKTLEAPLAKWGVPFELINWSKDLLPEFLWIHYVLHNHGMDVFGQIMDYIDMHVGSLDEPLFGVLSSFDIVPADMRETVLREMPAPIKAIFAEWSGVGSLYPNMPGNWLFLSDELPKTPHPVEESLGLLKSMILQLFNGKESAATMARAAALSRMMTHRKIVFSSKVTITIKSLAGYPQENEDERRLAESTIRALMAGILTNSQQNIGDWAKYFWRHNFKISACDAPPSKKADIQDSTEGSKGSENDYFDANRKYRIAQSEKIDSAVSQIIVDIYDPLRQQVLFGIIARQFRLLFAVLENLSNWADDVGSHLVRGMFENLLNMSYLESNPTLYERYVEYGVGQLKLYKLHLQDMEESLESDDIGLTDYIDQLEMAINDEIWEENLPINLSSWSGKAVREMAMEVGLEEQYRMIYQPYSIDVHGTWMSLVRWNLKRCWNPLHGFHYLPDFDHPEISFTVVDVAIDIFEQTVIRWTKAMDSPMDAGDILEPLVQFKQDIVVLE